MLHYFSRIFLFVLLLGSSGWLSGTTWAQTPHTHQHGFSGAEQWATVFDDPERDAWQKPHEVIQALALKPDAIIADIGAGTGYFSIRLAHMVPQGKVYGVDTEADMITYLRGRAQKAGLTNLEVITATPADPKLPEQVDVVMCVDVFHHLEKRTQYFEKIRTSLKPGGQVVVIDFRMDSPVGPPKAGRLTSRQIIAELTGAGFMLTSELEFLPNQYFMIFK